ncbi:acyl-CoA dehydrogenase (plasmid) [Rahnella aquatilis]|uniref:acyl-CoA dehydrogenase family protein n=1 Tax=Rahnella sp. RFA10(1/100) TaxID=2511202 RepID=UPI0010228285|nr:acyl-CoA dehydrogenase family protein [Rahnella sp. RFA10(1/100)]UJD92051.1 acyl-CoA dehydrogenase [Rahnella aquatilis]
MADITKLYPQLNELNAVLTAAGKLSEYNPDHAVTGFDHPELMSIACIGIPSRFNPWETAAFSDVDYSHHLQIIEYLSRTDASAMMMLPGASLSTRAILTLGTEQQQARFFSCFEHSPAWTFFAVTEPGVGSDATAVSCELTQNSQGWWLNGQKMLVGGAMRASAGLVFARYEQTHRLVMVFPQGKTGALQRELLDTFGLAGASLTRLTMTNLHIKEDDILGLGRRGLQQGLNALSKVFERHRPMVAAMALGTTYGLLKALETRPLPVAAKNWLAGQWRKYHALFQQMLTLAQGYHSGQQQYAQTSRLKLSATRLVEETARHLPDWLATQDWLEDTFLRKRYRDSFAFEYMEGTSNIHLLNSFRLPETRGDQYHAVP